MRLRRLALALCLLSSLLVAGTLGPAPGGGAGLPAGAAGQILAYDNSGGWVAYYAGDVQYPADIPPSSAESEDDEFNDGSISGQWTESSVGSGSYTNGEEKGALWTSIDATDGGQGTLYRMALPAENGTYDVCFSVSSSRHGATGAAVSVFTGDDMSNTVYTSLFWVKGSYDYNEIYMGRIETGTPSDIVYETDVPASTRYCIRTVYTTATGNTAYWQSVDGYTWAPIGDDTPSYGAASYLYLRVYAFSPQITTFRFLWFRRTA